MADIHLLTTAIEHRFGDLLMSKTITLTSRFNELTLELPPEQLLEMARILRDEEPLNFDMLIDVCGVDYLHHGFAQWQTRETTATGYERAVDERGLEITHWDKPRFAVVYHLLSMSQNHRLRLRCFLEGEPPMVESVVEVWPAANWFEREAFDLFGIVFKGHPDCRRILTDYGFIGHPFRKDFPLIGKVAMRYDAEEARCVYEPVSIPPRTLVPKVIRRYKVEGIGEQDSSKED